MPVYQLQLLRQTGVDSTLRDIRSGHGRGVRGENESSIDQWGNHISSRGFAVYPSKNLEVHRILLQATWRNVNTCANDTLNNAEKSHVFEADEVLKSHIQKLDIKNYNWKQKHYTILP